MYIIDLQKENTLLRANNSTASLEVRTFVIKIIDDDMEVVCFFKIQEL